MKTIGIKLADGTFYPVIEEGSPKTRRLALTTVKDNQTKVQIDLYRSESNSMDDAQYVDTLEISNLKEHPAEDPELNLSVGIDENNQLTAEVVDPETGKKSGTQVSLVSRTLEERSEPANFAIADAESSEEETKFDDKNPLEDFSFDDLSDETFAEPAKDPAAGIFDDDATIADSSDSAENLPDPAESIFDDTTLADDTAPASDTTLADNTDDSDNLEVTDFSLPDFDDTSSSDSSDLTEVNSENLTETDTSDLDGLFDDFDSHPAFTESTSSSESSDSSFDNSVFDTSSLDSDSMASNVTATSPAMDFSDLYDKETLEGGEDDERKTRVPMIICIICAIICVIATLLILFVVPSKYNLIKSRNTRNQKIEQNTEIAATEDSTPSQDIEIDVTPQKEEVPPAPIEAKEDKIVVAETPKVVPEPPKPAPVKKADIKYHIRWGDTLWDISEAYYKNPWKYKKLAAYNHIKNPDLIISGTDIKIPAE